MSNVQTLKSKRQINIEVVCESEEDLLLPLNFKIDFELDAVSKVAALEIVRDIISQIIEADKKVTGPGKMKFTQKLAYGSTLKTLGDISNYAMMHAWPHIVAEHVGGEIVPQINHQDEETAL